MSQNNYNPLVMNGFQPVNNAIQQPFYSGPYNGNVLNPQYGYPYGTMQTMSNTAPNDITSGDVALISRIGTASGLSVNGDFTYEYTG